VSGLRSAIREKTVLVLLTGNQLLAREKSGQSPRFRNFEKSNSARDETIEPPVSLSVFICGYIS
jgi:hypothetical protein